MSALVRRSLEFRGRRYLMLLTLRPVNDARPDERYVDVQVRRFVGTTALLAGWKLVGAIGLLPERDPLIETCQPPYPTTVLVRLEKFVGPRANDIIDGEDGPAEIAPHEELFIDLVDSVLTVDLYEALGLISTNS